MPMPPPNPSEQRSKGPGNPRRRREVEQMARALRDQGPADAETLKRLVGGAYWEQDRFDKALEFATSKSLVAREPDGRYRTP